MSRINQSNEYDALIKKIQRKRKTVIALTIIAVLIVYAACMPVRIEFLNETIVDYKGINPVITVVLVILILFIEGIAYALVSSPLTTSMDIECDPQKHLVLNDILNKKKNKDNIYAADYFYMGNFEAALNYANRMISGNNPALVILGLLNKARCEYFLGDFESLKLTVEQYEDSLNNLKKVNQKTKDAFDKISKSMKLLVAISEEDKEGISCYKGIEAWNNSKATEGYINYLKGIAAFIEENKEEAVYRFMSVKEKCPKTFLAGKSQEYLGKIK